MAQDTNSINAVLQELDKITEDPTLFLTSPESLLDLLKKQLKISYDFMKCEEEFISVPQSLPKLIIEHFDLEQIWQQIELQNEEIVDKSVVAISKVMTNANKLAFNGVAFEPNANNSKSESTSNADSNTVDDNGSMLEESASEPMTDEEDAQVENGKANVVMNRQKPSIVDDDFFKLQEMENFLNSEENKLDEKHNGNDLSNSSESDSEEAIDLFQEHQSDDDESSKNNPKYKDFFSEENSPTKTTKRNKFFEKEDEIQSSLKLREERLKKKIIDIEHQALSEKPWQLKGEITADCRPQNSLLEEIVEFDLTSRPAPVITEETTLRLEDIIKQRIKDKTFDSVIRKEKPVETPLEYKKKLVLDQEKSKESLAQIYEKEYLKQQESVNPNSTEDKEDEPEIHKEIKKLTNSLFAKLDALSNFHFTPKPAVPELKIVTNLPAINMEEVAPIASSDATLLAPEEVKNKMRGELLSKAERSDTDKKRERRKKKLKQKIHVQQKLQQSKNTGNPKHGAKYAKNIVKSKDISMMNESSGRVVKSSAAFFTHLQEEVQTQIKHKSEAKKNKETAKYNAKKIKL